MCHCTLHLVRCTPAYIRGDGNKVYRNCIDLLANAELQVTRETLDSSLGWVMMMDGSAKGRYETKGVAACQAGELVLFRDIGPDGEVRTRTLGMMFVTPGDSEQLSIQPFAADAWWIRTRDMM